MQYFIKCYYICMIPIFRMSCFFNQIHRDTWYLYKIKNRKMVSKLKFKNKYNSKKKIEKPIKHLGKPTNTPKIERIPIDKELVSSIIKTSWYSASDITESVNVVLCTYNLLDIDEVLVSEKKDIIEFYKTLAPYVISISEHDQVIMNNESDFSILTQQENDELQKYLNLSSTETSQLKINNIVPESKSQVFKLIVIPNSSSNNSISKPLKVAFKSQNGKYLSADKKDSQLTLSHAITDINEIFTLQKIKHIDFNSDISWYSITQGNRKLILLESSPGLARLRLVEDVDDLVDSLNRFVLRIPMKDDPIGKKILQSL